MNNTKQKTNEKHNTRMELIDHIIGNKPPKLKEMISNLICDEKVSFCVVILFNIMYEPFPIPVNENQFSIS